MNETEVLKLRKPSENDFYSVEDFNHNMDILEEDAAKRITTVRVCGDIDSVASLTHSSGLYTKTVTEHADTLKDGTPVKYNYAEFKLPCGGHASITHVVNGNKHSQTCVLVDGNTEWIISHTMTSYHHPLSKAPDNFFVENKNFSFLNDRGVFCRITKMTLSEIQAVESEFDYAEDYKNFLWHAVRTGMITAEEYATATGEEYPSLCPFRVTQY